MAEGALGERRRAPRPDGVSPGAAVTQPAIAYLADDLSGASSSASLLCEAGLREVCVLEYEGLGTAPPGRQAYVVSTAGRDLAAARAGERLQRSIESLRASLAGRTILWGKRLDSTLRGHIALELRLLRGALPDGPALVAPAFPRAGRRTVGGYQLVDGPSLDGPLLDSPLLDSPLLDSPLLDGSPLESPPMNAQAGVESAPTHLPSLVAEAGYAALHPLSLDALRGRAPPEALGALRPGDALIADAASEGDLTALAAWSYGLWLRGAVVVDSGPFLAQLARLGVGQGLWPAVARPSPILVVLGSRSALTGRQLEHLRKTCSGLLVLQPDFGPAQAAEARAADVVALTADAQGDVGVALDALAAAASRLVERLPAPYAFILSGGRTASSVLARLDAGSLEMRGEVLPLAPLGRLVGGRLGGSLLVTKGGLVGGPDTLSQLVKFLQLIRRLV